MAKFQLNSGETLIGSGMMSIYLKQKLSKKPFQGNIYTTNQRACFKISMPLFFLLSTLFAAQSESKRPTSECNL